MRNISWLLAVPKFSWTVGAIIRGSGLQFPDRSCRLLAMPLFIRTHVVFALSILHTLRGLRFRCFTCYIPIAWDDDTAVIEMRWNIWFANPFCWMFVIWMVPFHCLQVISVPFHCLQVLSMQTSACLILRTMAIFDWQVRRSPAQWQRLVAPTLDWNAWVPSDEPLPIRRVQG